MSYLIIAIFISKSILDNTLKDLKLLQEVKSNDIIS